jgi:hypothetical protein
VAERNGLLNDDLLTRWTRTDLSQIFDIITMVIMGVIGLGVCPASDQCD